MFFSKELPMTLQNTANSSMKKYARFNANVKLELLSRFNANVKLELLSRCLKGQVIRS